MPPILVETDSNTKIPESMAIASYLESQYPTNGLGSLYTCPNSTQSLQESKGTKKKKKRKTRGKYQQQRNKKSRICLNFFFYFYYYYYYDFI